jgi:hypothetical protein
MVTRNRGELKESISGKVLSTLMGRLSMERSAVGLKPGSGCDRGQCRAELFQAVSADLLGPRGLELCTDVIDCLCGVPPARGQADGLNPGILLVLNALNVASCLKVIDERAHRLLCHPGGDCQVREPTAPWLDPAQYLAMRRSYVGKPGIGQALMQLLHQGCGQPHDKRSDGRGSQSSSQT